MIFFLIYFLSDVTYKDVQFPLYDAFSCVDRCALDSFTIDASCYCDPDCVLFNDCCVDYHETCHNTNKTKSNLSPDLFSCTPLDESYPQRGSVLLISKCPSGWTDQTLRTLCETYPLDDMQYVRSPNIGGVFKWHVFDRNGNNFKNMFCSICNGNHIFESQPWVTHNWKSLSPGNEEDACNEPNNMNKEPTHLIDRTVGHQLRSCPMVDSCPKTFEEDSESMDNLTAACQSYSAMICIDNKIYKNYHCGLCNGGQLLHAIAPCNQYYDEQILGQPVFRSLWQFTRTENPQIDYVASQCSSKEKVFDPVLRNCIPLTCTQGFIYDTSTAKCIASPLFPNAINGMCCVQQESWIVYSEPRSVQDNHNGHKCLPENLNLVRASNVSDWTQYELTHNANAMTKVLLKSRNAVCNLANELDEDILESADLFENCRTDVIEYMHVCQKDITSHSCNGLWFHGNADEFVLVHMTPLAEVFLYRNEFIMPFVVIDYISYEYDLLAMQYNKIETVLVCGNKVHHLRCPLVTLVREEFVTTEDNEKLVITVNMKNYTLEKDEYILLPDGRAQICTHHLEDVSSKLFEYSGYLDKVNIIGCSLSLIGFSGVFGIHCVFPTLRHFPGRSLMCHCLTMFWAQLIPMLSVKISTTELLCVFLALSSHFFWLCAFAWMTIMTVNLTYLLVWQPLQRSEDREDTLLYRYYIPLMGWGLPLVIVLLSSCLHISGTFGFEYGNGSPCWISGNEANLIAFGVPVGVSLTCNVVCYIACLISICKRQQRRSHFRQAQTMAIYLQDVIISMKVIMFLFMFILCVF